MSPLDDAVRAFIAGQPVGVLATERADGTIRQSLVYHVVEGDRLLVSTMRARAKTRDVERSGRASYCVTGHERPFPSVTIEGPARIVTDDVGSATTRIMEKITGNPMSQVLTDEQCAAMDRVILAIDVAHVYGASYLPGG